jgi:hypothetical protein
MLLQQCPASSLLLSCVSCADSRALPQALSCHRTTVSLTNTIPKGSTSQWYFITVPESTTTNQQQQQPEQQQQQQQQQQGSKASIDIKCNRWRGLLVNIRHWELRACHSNKCQQIAIRSSCIIDTSNPNANRANSRGSIGYALCSVQCHFDTPEPHWCYSTPRISNETAQSKW